MESIYKKALIIRLQKDGLNVEVEKEIKTYYDNNEIGRHRLDLVAENEIIIELKTLKAFDNNHIAQILSYLKATNLKIGLLLNFENLL